MSDLLKGYGVKKISLDTCEVVELHRLKGKLITMTLQEDIDINIIDKIIKRYEKAKNEEV